MTEVFRVVEEMGQYFSGKSTSGWGKLVATGH